MSKKSPAARKARAERLKRRTPSLPYVRDLERRHHELDEIRATGAFEPPELTNPKPGKARVILYMTLEHNVWLVIVMLDHSVSVNPVLNYNGPDELCTKIAEFIQRKGGSEMDLVERLSPWHDDEIDEDVYSRFCQSIKDACKETSVVVTHTWGTSLDELN
jgi:hypothetical protein